MLIYTVDAEYVGRNGAGIQRGLEMELHKEVVSLEPVNSKGNVANCKIEVPVVNLDDVISGLQKLRDEWRAKIAKPVTVQHDYGAIYGPGTN